MSIESDLSERTISFASHWNEKTESFPIFELDGSWPSIGTISLLSSILIQKIDLTVEELNFIDILSWYVGSIVKLVWADAGVSSELNYGSDGVEVIGKLPEAGDLPFKVKLSLVLKVLLQRLPLPVPVLTTYLRELPSSTDLLSPVILGILFCQSPLLEGIEEDADQTLFLQLSEKIVKILSKSTAQYYEKCFPDEHLGQMAEIYLAGQIYPPLGMSETWPCINSSTELIKSVREMGASNRAILKFAENLLTLPTENLSFTGLVVTAALSKERLSPQSSAQFEIRANFLGFLRPAIVNIKDILGIGGDWVKSQLPGDEDLASYEIEKRLGLLPWINMKSSVLRERSKEPKIAKLLKSLIGFDISGSIGIADSIIDKDPSNLEVRFQRINLHLLAGEIQQAEFAIRLLATEPEAENDPRLYLLWAKIDLAVENPAEAIRHLELALSCWKNEQDIESLFREVVLGLIVKGEAAEALRALKSLPLSSKPSFSCLLNEFRALTALGRDDQSQVILRQLVELCPISPEIFYSFFLKQ